jgi:hypothetical protein
MHLQDVARAGKNVPIWKLANTKKDLDTPRTDENMHRTENKIKI